MFVQTEFNETYPAFSPDGRWVAYTSGESGRNEVYVVPFPGPGGKWQVSQAGGAYPRWRGDSAELFFHSSAGPLMSASVDGRGSAFLVGAITPLFEARIRNVGFGGTNSNNYDVTPDGQRFLVAVTDDAPAEPPITVLVNWESSASTLVASLAMLNAQCPMRRMAMRSSLLIGSIVVLGLVASVLAQRGQPCIYRHVGAGSCAPAPS